MPVSDWPPKNISWYYVDDSVAIANGDCLEVMKEFDDKSIDLVLTDPPYGIGISNNPFRQKHKKSNWDNHIPDKNYFNEIFRVSKNQVIWGGNYFHLPPTQCFYIWDKIQPINFSSAMCEFAWCSKSSPAKLFKKRVVEYKKWHSTQKPIEIMNWVLEQFKDCNIILDPFLGSGTTARACKDLGRKCIGIEISKEYCDIAVRRLGQEVLPL